MFLYSYVFRRYKISPKGQIYVPISSSAQAFLERLLFAADTYVLDEEGNRVSKIEREIKTAMIYTMNVPKEMDYFNGEDQLSIMRDI